MRVSVSVEIFTVSAEADSDKQDAGLCFFMLVHLGDHTRDALLSGSSEASARRAQSQCLCLGLRAVGSTRTYTLRHSSSQAYSFLMAECDGRRSSVDIPPVSTQFPLGSHYT